MSARLTSAALVLCLVSACAAPSRYAPRTAVSGELSMRRGENFEMWSGDTLVAQGHGYDGLPEFVRCVPKAHAHAARAESAGTTAMVLTATAVGLALVGLGGLAGVGVEDRGTKALLLGGGVMVEVGAVVSAALSRSFKVKADGNAVDAVNYYNDALGSRGASCTDPSSTAGASR